VQVVFLNKRRGFIRMAISAGAPLVPVFIFGQVGHPREEGGETTKTGGEDCCAHLSNLEMWSDLSVTCQADYYFEPSGQVEAPRDSHK
jgi:hypothetical protein